MCMGLEGVVMGVAICFILFMAFGSWVTSDYERLRRWESRDDR